MLRQALLVAALLVCAGSADAQVTLRYNHWLPPDHHIDKNVFRPWMDKVAEVTNGRVKIEPTVSSLGPVLKQYDLVSTGVADVVFTAESYTPGLFPLADILSLPAIGTDPEKLSTAYWKVYETYFAKANPYPRVHVLGLTAFPIYHLFNARREIATSADLRGLKMTTTGEVKTELLKNLGATVVSAGLTQLVEMTTSGVIDGVMTTDDAVNSFSLARLVKYRTTFPKGLGSASSVIMINEAKWNAISAEDRAAIDAISGPLLAQKMGASLKAADTAGREANEKAGVKTTIASKELEDFADAAAKPLEAAWIEKAKAKGVDGAAALKMLRDLAQ